MTEFQRCLLGITLGLGVVGVATYEYTSYLDQNLAGSKVETTVSKPPYVYNLSRRLRTPSDYLRSGVVKMLVGSDNKASYWIQYVQPEVGQNLSCSTGGLRPNESVPCVIQLAPDFASHAPTGDHFFEVITHYSGQNSQESSVDDDTFHYRLTD